MPTIRIDDDVYQALQAQATPFRDTPNDVLRRVLALPLQEAAARSASDLDVERAPGWTPTRYLSERWAIVRLPDGTELERGRQSARGVDLNQVQTDVHPYVGRRNPDTRRALDQLLSGHRRVTIGPVQIEVFDK